jgi:predicted RNase H-like HicB family nuclease
MAVPQNAGPELEDEMKKSKYEAVIERDADGWWVATVPSVDGCFTQGKTIAQARERIQEALELCLEESGKKGAFDLVTRIELPPEARRILEQALKRREQADAAAVQAKEATVQAARVLNKKGISRRDAAELLGVSHQRIQQLVATK